MDPTTLAVLSIFGGAALTAVAGFVGAWLQGRREHSRWLREQRYEAFTRFMAYQHRVDVIKNKSDRLDAQMASAISDAKRDLLRADTQVLRSELSELEATIPDAVTAMYLLGSRDVEAKGRAYMQGRLDGDDRAAEAAFLEAMRAALGVKG
ncbi:hypothetical protein ACWIBQ_01620 [Microbacterium keratanolyticum]